MVEPKDRGLCAFICDIIKLHISQGNRNLTGVEPVILLGIGAKPCNLILIIGIFKRLGIAITTALTHGFPL